MSDGDEIIRLTAERDALIEELDAAHLLIGRMKNRLREVRELRATVKAMRKKYARPLEQQ